MNLLKLIRFPNLIMIALIQVMIKYGLFQPINIHVALDDFHFTLLVFATFCIAAGGNIINDIYDVPIDRINKPHKVIVGRSISEKTANGLYILFTVIGVAIGFYLSNSVGHPGFAAVFIGIAGLLYMYASYLKGMLFIGNLVISALVAFSLIILILFDIFPVINTELIDHQLISAKIVFQYAGFAFVLTFIREIVKDLQDINGDKNGGMNTLPIAIGRQRATYVVIGLCVLTLIIILAFMYTYLYNVQIAMLYFLFLVVAPLLYLCIASWSAKINADYAKLSLILKVIMFSGMCSVLLMRFVIL